MDLAKKLSRGSLNLRPSEIRDLFEGSSEVDLISLAGGMPNLESLPFDEIGESMKHTLANEGTKLWQYGEASGDKGLKEEILKICKLENVTANLNNVLISAGSQLAMDFVARILINPGDVVLAEEPNYVGALGVFMMYQAQVVNLVLDDDGLVPESLEETIIGLKAQGKTIKFLYTVPNFHNPSGITLTQNRRPKILEICKKYDVLILEDNPYGLLDFQGRLHQAIYSYDYDEKIGCAPNVIYLGSFSKFIAPGLRCGWIIAPDIIKEKLIVCMENSLLCPSYASQITIRQYLRNFDWLKQVEKYRKVYYSHYQAMKKALEKYLPQVSFTQPEGGFFVWVKVPENIDTSALLTKAVQNGVSFLPGSGFYANSQGHDHLRLCFSLPNEKQIEEGIKRLAKTIESFQK